MPPAGITEVERLTDKVVQTNNTIATRQVSLFSHSDDSLLYQEMLSFKASSMQRDTSAEDSDWEVLSGDNYDGDSEASSFSEGGEGEEGDSDVGLGVGRGRKRGSGETLRAHSRSGGSSEGRLGNGFLEEDVSYYTPRFSRGLDGVGRRGEEGAGDPLFPQTARPISPKISIRHMRTSSGEVLSSMSDDHRPFLTPAADSTSDADAVYQPVRLGRLGTAGSGRWSHGKHAAAAAHSGSRGSVRTSSRTSTEQAATPSSSGVQRRGSLLGRSGGEKGGGGGATPLTRGAQAASAATSNTQYVWG